MQRISVEEMQENFDQVIENVEYGESFIITMDGEDRAVLMPYDSFDEMKDFADRYERLVE
jgi:prevent-host-death family protein